MEKEVRALKDKLASGQGVDLAAGAVDVKGVKVVATKVDGADAGALRNAVDQLKDRLKSAVVVLASVESPTKVVLVARRDRRSGHSREGGRVGRGDCRAVRRSRRVADLTSRRREAVTRRRSMQRWPRCRSWCGRSSEPEIPGRASTARAARPSRRRRLTLDTIPHGTPEDSGFPWFLSFL